jgi:hypothetical protein
VIIFQWLVVFHSFDTYILQPVSTSFSVHTVRYPADVSRKAKIHSVLDWHHSNLRQGAGASYSTPNDVHTFLVTSNITLLLVGHIC